MARAARAVGQHIDNGPRLLEPTMNADFMPWMSNEQGAFAARIDDAHSWRAEDSERRFLAAACWSYKCDFFRQTASDDCGSEQRVATSLSGLRDGGPSVFLQEVEKLNNFPRFDTVGRAFAFVEAVALDEVG